MSLTRALERVWYPGADRRVPPLARALAVPELAFRAAAAARGAMYERGWLPSVRVQGARVISIGNLTVGGSGKTPAVIDLASMLCADREARLRPRKAMAAGAAPPSPSSPRTRPPGRRPATSRC